MNKAVASPAEAVADIPDGATVATPTASEEQIAAGKMAVELVP